MSAERPPLIEVRRGWPAALASLALAGVGVVLVRDAAVNLTALALVLATAGVVVLAVGLLAGSEPLVGLASLPFLGGAVTGLPGPGGVAWVPALVIGLVWYGASELGWASIEARTDTIRTSDIAVQRAREVSSVVLVTALVGVAATILVGVAPARTALAKALATALVLVGLMILGRRASRTGTEAPTRAKHGG